MKKTFLPHLPVLGLLFAGLFLFGSASTAVAQQTLASSDPLFSEPKGPFVTVAEAIVKMDIEAGALKTQLSGMTPGTFAYKQMLAKYDYFSAIHDLLVQGKGVAEAIVEGIKKIAADQYGITQENLLAYRQEAITILKQ